MAIVSGSCFASELTYIRFYIVYLPRPKNCREWTLCFIRGSFGPRLILCDGGACIFPLCGTAVIVSISNPINTYVSLFSVAGAHRAMSSGTQMPGNQLGPALRQATPLYLLRPYKQPSLGPGGGSTWRGGGSAKANRRRLGRTCRLVLLQERSGPVAPARIHPLPFPFAPGALTAKAGVADTKTQTATADRSTTNECFMLVAPMLTPRLSPAA
jgi:hypothetical protein